VNIFKRLFLILTFLAITTGIGSGAAFAYQIYIDGTDDAGTYAGEQAFVTLMYDGGSMPVTTADVSTRWTSQAQVWDYAGSKNVANLNAWIKSAGNIWSSDTTVGESLTGLSAGTYHITPVQATYLAFQRDTFNWSQYYGKYWWELKITAKNVFAEGEWRDSYTFTLAGDTNGYDTAELAFDAVLNSYLDVILGDGGTLTFWIYDDGTVDNAGGLTVEITMVPEPSTLLLLLLGVPFVFRKLRN